MNDQHYNELEDSEDSDVLDNPSCPICGGVGIPLGSLGKLIWFICRNCGAQFSQEAQQ